MRFFGHTTSSAKPAFSLGFLLFLIAVCVSPVSGQTAAPYVLPYTMSTFAGPHAAYTPGAACGAYIALDAAGDGCLASQVQVGTDPHDIRVDGQGNVYWIDNNAGTAIIHKINALTGRQTVYVGSLTGKICSTNSNKTGDGCPANDGAANLGSTNTAGTPKSRGLGLAPNGDLYFADYGGDLVHRVSITTGLQTIVSGIYTSPNTANPPIGGPVGTAQLNTARGVSADANGNVYIADTGDGSLRVVYGGGTISGVSNGVVGSTYSLTAYNPSTVNTKQYGQNIPLSSAILNAPEDVQVDSYGNVFVADTGNGTVRAIYNGRGTLPGIPNPVTGNIYTVAGYNALSPTLTQNAYPKDGTTPTFPAQTVAISDRKIALDKNNNLYIADSNSNVVWFVDAVTGNIRLLAGVYGGAAGSAPVCATATNNVGDGCPGPMSALYSAADMGTSPDNQGNLYITDAEGGVASSSRLRKLLSGLNFPATAKGSTVTQTVLIHFTAGDTRAIANAFVLTGTGSATLDYTLGTITCNTQTDNTTDCLVPITYTPKQPGYDTATLTINSALGNSSSYLVTGTGITSAIAIDPGSVSLQNATVKAPQGVFVDSVGNIYTADTGNNRVLLYNAATATTTVIAGTGVAGNTGDAGLATAATLNGPRAVTIDTSGAVYIADTGNNTVRRVLGGIITTIGGSSTGVCTGATNSRGDGCAATQAIFSAPAGLAADSLGVIYVSDTGNNVIRAISTTGYVSTLAGGATAICSNSAGATDVYGDGCFATQTIFRGPTGLAFDATGSNLIVADTGDNIVRSIYLANAITTTTAAGVTPTAAGTTVSVNPVTLVAGTGFGGAVLDNNNTAALSQLNAPTGVAIGAARNIYIADTANSAIRLVSPAGTISTIVGVLGGAGTGSALPATAANVQLNAPAAVAVTPIGTLEIADSGNNRVLTDVRSQVTFDFGRVGITRSSPAQTFTESSIGNVAATLPTPLLTPSAVQTQFTLVPATTGGCASGTFTIGASCQFVGQFTPAATGTFSVTYTETGANTAAGDPSITLTGTGAILTNTTSTVAQTTPTGNSQFGQNLTLTGTVTAATCNAAAPTCYPTGTVRFIVDGTPGTPIFLTGTGATSTSSTAAQTISGLTVGAHTISCNYSGDNYYAASTCGNQTITVVTASTTSLLSVTNNNQPQFLANNCTTDNKGITTCIVSVVSAQVVSNTVGIPTGTVTFLANGVTIGTGSIDPNTGKANLVLQFVRDQGSNVTANNTLAPGTYQLTCTYSGAANYAVSSCPALTYTVTGSPVDFSLTVRGCQATSLIPSGSLGSSLAVPCTVANYLSGVPLVAVAQGSTTDATIFVTPSNTVGGNLTFSCSGLPHATTCTFYPTSITLTAGTGAPSPVAVDMTLWTDLQPGVGVADAGKVTGNIAFAAMFGWPLTMLGLVGVLRFRRKVGSGRALALLALLLMIGGSSLAVTGCGAGGPGAYKAVLSPAGTYPITVTVTGGGVTHTTLVYWTITAPGIPGQQ